MSIDIIGAGIGGLTLALALEQKGIKYRVYEEANEIKPVGAGIILANNAMQVYEKLGLKNEIEELGCRMQHMKITNTNLNAASSVDLSLYEKKYGVKNIAIHRGELQKLLLKKIDPKKIHLNKKLESLEKKEPFLLNFSDATQVKSDIVIGADGINSIVRNSFFSNSKIRKAEQVCWRGVTKIETPKEFKNDLNEAWGGNERFGFIEISENKVYWYALKTIDKSINEYTKDDLDLYFKKFHPFVKNLINATPKSQIHTAAITDLKPISNWSGSNFCLIGDAAHAMSPNMGQGACQAIEDSYVLSECLNKYTTEKAFLKYQELRIEKATGLVNLSWRLGKMAHITNPFLIKIIRLIFRLTPSYFQRLQLDKIYKLASV
jgi:2-polyprenyl-6-methoxyphenol hydroxylase-like FAD-dependent oxidoreductase|tara:strand:- start:19173 stop:20303 length:1131 start_codon:yes stop_codon:yes gene_type:complete